jgi:hypothetical protein
MIAVICDACGDVHPQSGPNTGPVTIPAQWVQVSLEAKMQPTVVQHQCPQCFKALADAQRERRATVERPKLPR